MAESTGRNALADCIQRVEIVGQTDLVFDVECFTDDSGTTFYGVWELVDNALVLNFYTVDVGGNLTPYAPTSTPVPCDLNDIETTQQCWVALADGVGYSQDDQIQQIHFWDTTTTPNTLTDTIWYNQTTRQVIATAPPQADLEPCAFSSGVLPGCYRDADGNYFDAVVTLNVDGTVGTMVIDNVVTDPAPGTLVVGRPCYACCVPSGEADTFQHADLPHADIATAAGFLAGTTEYNGNLCGDTIRLDPFDLTVVQTEVATSPEPIFTWGEVANGGAHRIILSSTGTLRMGFASCDGAFGETVVFSAQKPDRIFPGTGSSIANQAALDALSLPITWDNGNSSDATYFEWDNVDAVEFTVNPQAGVVMRGFVDSVTFDNAHRWTTDDCCGCDSDEVFTVVSYIEECTPVDIELSVNLTATFSDTINPESTITVASVNVGLLLSQLRLAQQYQVSEEANGLPVTPFVINTDDGIYRFPPSAFLSYNGTALVIDTAQIIDWPFVGETNITTVQYSIFSGCQCRPVEMVQRINGDGSATIISILDSSVYDAQGNKLVIPLPLPFGTTGPFPGPCPPEQQVLDLDDLCCNDDLEQNEPDIAQQAIAWVDAAETVDNFLHPFPGGAPIAGNDGDLISEILPKVGATSWIVSQTAGTIGGPAIYRPNQVGALAGIEIDPVVQGTILDLDVAPRPAGTPFTLFTLYSRDTAAGTSLLAVKDLASPDGTFADGSFQIVTLGAGITDGPDWIWFRINGAPAVQNTLLGFHERDNLADNWRIAHIDESIDGLPHLITYRYDGFNLRIFFDGELRVHTELTTPTLQSELFRLGINLAFIPPSAGTFGQTVYETIYFGNELTTNDTATVNAYLICKWGIDPSAAAGGAGDLTLAADGTYSAPTPFVRILRSDGAIVYRNTLTGVEFPVPPVPGLSVCASDSEKCIVNTGYIQACTPFNITLPINTDGTFSDNAAATSALDASLSTATLITSALLDAQEYENAQVDAGQTVTNFIIRTAGGDVFEFPPSAFVSSTSTQLTFTTAALVAWPGPLTDTIAQIEYSKFDGCTCSSVEMVQLVNDATGQVTLLNTVDPSIRDENGVKQSVEFTFGVTGPFPGPCPAADQVLELDPLCCDDDLATNNPGIASLRLAWLDGADVALMTPLGGAIGTAVDGDEIERVEDKIGGLTPFVIPANVAPGDDPAPNGPTLVTDAINGLSVLNFDDTNLERLRLDSGNPPGDSFTLFYLFRSPINGVGNQSILAVSPNSGDGGSFLPPAINGGWQFSRDSLQDTFIFRIGGDAGDPDPVDVFASFSPATDDSWAAGDVQWEQTIAPLAEAYDGQLHLLTATYDNTTNDLRFFFDGELRYHGVANPAAVGIANIGSDYFRIFGNRAGNAYNTGQIAEMFFADSVLTPEQTGTVNAYLICKWGIDPSLAAGGAGDLTLAPAGTYSTPTDLVRIVRSDGTILYRNTATGLEFPVPPVPGLSICIDESCFDCATTIRSYARAFNGITALTTIASLLQGGTFTGMSITAISSNNGSVQYTDSSGTVTPMYVGQTKNISAEDLGQLDETGLAIELTDAADIVVIDWTERV